MFIKAGIIERHATMHERLDFLVRHVATLPDKLWQASTPDQGETNVRRQEISTFGSLGPDFGRLSPNYSTSLHAAKHTLRMNSIHS